MYYDLHIHSCLSPCADDDMTPNNIVNMAILNGLEMIAVTDHNSLLQQKVIHDLCLKKGIRYIYGVEVQSKEDVHILCYFKKYAQIIYFQEYIDKYLIKIANEPNYFGHQYLRDINDEIVDEYNHLLLMSLDQSIEDIINFTKDINGIVVLAHIDGRENAIINNLGFIPDNLRYDGLEIPRKENIELYRLKYPECQIFLHNSDAHRLVDIQERVIEFDRGVKKIFL